MDLHFPRIYSLSTHGYIQRLRQPRLTLLTFFEGLFLRPQSVETDEPTLRVSEIHPANPLQRHRSHPKSFAFRAAYTVQYSADCAIRKNGQFCCALIVGLSPSMTSKKSSSPKQSRSTDMIMGFLTSSKAIGTLSSSIGVARTRSRIPKSNEAMRTTVAKLWLSKNFCLVKLYEKLGLTPFVNY